MIEPKDIDIDGRVYTLSKIPAIPARRIFTQYLSSAAPKVGDYSLNESLMLELLSYVGVKMPGGNTLQLTTQELVNNHVPTWTGLMKLEAAMAEYNCGFFQDGRIQNFLEDIAQNLPQWITQILTDSLQQLSVKNTPPSTN